MLAFNLLTINSEFFLMLFNTWDIIDFPIIKTIFLALGYSLATLYIMIFFSAKNKIFEYCVKLIFPIIDGLIVYVFFNSEIGNFAPYMALAYGVFTVLILFFVSETGMKYFRPEKKTNESHSEYFESLKKTNESLLKQVKSYEKDFNSYEMIKSEIEIKNDEIQRLTSDLQTAKDFIFLGIEKYVSKLRMKKIDPERDKTYIEITKKFNYNEKA
jgi:hypothetical protein